ncbi:MAG: HEAT repeat domain-containing protein [Pirellulales bacterium]
MRRLELALIAWLALPRLVIGQETLPPKPLGDRPAVSDIELDPADECAKELASPQPEVRLAALDKLSERRPEGRLRALVKTLADPDPRVSTYAALHLYYLATDQRQPARDGKGNANVATPPGFEKLLADAESPRVRGLISLAWEQTAPETAVALPWALKGLMQLDADRSSEALFLVYDSRLAETLSKCLADGDSEVRRGAARAAYAARSCRWSNWKTSGLSAAVERALQHADPWLRGHAVLTLASDDAFADEQIAAMTKDDDEYVRCCAIRALSSRDKPMMIAALTPLAQHDPSERVQLRAIIALMNLVASQEGEEARNRVGAQIKLEGLARVLFENCSNDPFNPWKPPGSMRVRESDADAMIARIKTAIDAERRLPLPPYNEFANGRHSDEFDLGLLQWIGECIPLSRAALPFLFQELRSGDSLGDDDCRTSRENRRLATLLGALHDDGSRGPQATLELARALDDPHRVVRTMAAIAIVGQEPHTARCIPILIESLNHSCAGQCNYSELLRWDVSALAEAGPSAVPALLSSVRQGKNVDLAAMALRYMGGESARVVPMLLERWEDRREPASLRQAISVPLGQLGASDDKTGAALQRALQDRTEPEGVRAAAARALARTDADPRPVLLQYRDDESSEVQRAVREALKMR